MQSGWVGPFPSGNEYVTVSFQDCASFNYFLPLLKMEIEIKSCSVRNLAKCAKSWISSVWWRLVKSIVWMKRNNSRDMLYFCLVQVQATKDFCVPIYSFIIGFLIVEALCYTRDSDIHFNLDLFEGNSTSTIFATQHFSDTFPAGWIPRNTKLGTNILAKIPRVDSN